jgi:two-component system, cell cycle sensor histidine kinase and response regulator CckA
MSEGDPEEELGRLRAQNERLEAELAEEKEKFRLFFQGAPLAIGIFSFEEARFLDVNERYLDLSGMSREEFFRCDPYEFWMTRTHPEDLEIERREVQRMVEGQIDSYRMKKRYLAKNGEFRWAEFVTDSVRDARGRLRYSILQYCDIHEQHTAVETRERLEERLHQAQKLEGVGRLVGGVAHDFNNRLLVIMGYAELLKRGAVGNPELEGHAEVVLTSARRAADLTHQLLAYGRRQVLKPRPCDLNGVVDRMRRMLERVIGESIELVTVLGAKQAMHADPGQIEQVLMNLVLNARDAMPDGGRIAIETGDASVAAGAMPDLAAGSYVTLSVADTGTGIADAVREQIFEPFFTTKEVGKGTGLGLAMVDGIVRQSGGVVSVKSGEGRGATFTVYLPRAKEPKRSESPAPVADPVAHLTDVETVLVVDDEDDVRRLLVDVLAIGAYHVLEARDGQQALEVAEAHKGSIRLLVTDVVMPKMKGPELSERLRKRYPALRTLYVSGYAERETLTKLGPHEHFLSKPFLPVDLFRIARDILASQASERAERAG